MSKQARLTGVQWHRAARTFCRSAKGLPKKYYFYMFSDVQPVANSTGTMPLTRASDRFVMRQGNLHFLMKDGEAEVVCAISPSVLLSIGQAAGLNNPVFAFWAFREKIEGAASAKYDRTARVEYEVLTIEERDLAVSDQSAESVRPLK
jgi:hypothetical protein